MFIVIHAGGMGFNGGTIASGKSLGGSESAAYHMSKELAKLGHRVIVFTNSKEGGVWDNVRYEWAGDMSQQFPLGDRFHFYMQTPTDVLIIQRHPLAFSRGWEFNTKVNIWWLHDLALKRSQGAVNASLTFIDKVFTVSEFHKNQVSEVYNVDGEHVVATWNGIAYDSFKGLEDVKREPRSLVYAARPERGLEHLVGNGGIMEMLKDCHLYVCGYENTTEQMRPYYEYLWSRCDQLPNVTNMGSLGKADLNRLLAKSMLYVYPTQFEDTSCIAVLEAQAAGTPVITSEIAALPETLKDAGAVLIKHKDSFDRFKFARKVESILNDESRWQSLHKKALAKRQTWEDAAKQWTDVFTEILLSKSVDDTYRLYRHLEHMSDIVAMSKDTAKKLLPDFEANYGFYLTGDYAGHYDRYYDREYDEKKIDYGPEDLSGNERYLTIRERVRSIYEEWQANNKKMDEGCRELDSESAAVRPVCTPFTILDYGCAHGHYVMNLARDFPNIEIHGIDINARNIDTAQKWLDEVPEYKDRVYFYHGTHENIPFDDYGLIIASEVLEHVPNPQAVVDGLQEHLSSDGAILISVPYGPWEAQGYQEEEGWRAHIHHFERADLHDMFAHHKDFSVISQPYKASGLGHYIVTFKPEGITGNIDYARKLSTQAPRQTVSVCMIARDAEYTIGKIFERLAPIADEFIIGVDKLTKDNTKEICERFGATVIDIDSPTVQGFDEARNKTIELAKMDWVLWLDDDEKMAGVEHLEKYLRENAYDAYAIPHHHYSAEPATVMKTDLPCRLFRNHKGVRFFGVVHEHPEKELNKGIGRIIALSDVSIMHWGYETEAVRRKRFKRNFPLMQADRKKYPDRVLGTFLWARDLSHLIRYESEAAGRLTPNARVYAEEIIKCWRLLVKENHVRMAKDCLPYLTHAVQTLGGGIQYAFNNGASRMNGGPKMEDAPFVAEFVNAADIRDFQNAVTEAKIGAFEDKYF